MEQKLLFHIAGDYRAPLKVKITDKSKKGYKQYKKGTFVWGEPYNRNAEGVVMSVLLDDQYIVPSGYVQLLNEQQTAEYLEHEKKAAFDAEPQEQETTADVPVPDVEKLNDTGKSIMAESTEKLKSMSFDVSKKLNTNYTKIGVGVGAAAGLGLSLYFKANLWKTIMFTVVGAGVVGFIGSKIKKPTTNETATKTA